ncbi:MAG TPA: hypothetical protein VI979_00070 [archaeon]|nr:hypothetical protein [archaeon]
MHETRDYGFGLEIDRLIGEGYEMKERVKNGMRFVVLSAPSENAKMIETGLNDLTVAYVKDAVIGAKYAMPGINIWSNGETFHPTETYAVRIDGDHITIYTAICGQNVISQTVLGILGDEDSYLFAPANPEACGNLDLASNGFIPPSAISYEYLEDKTAMPLPDGSTHAKICIMRSPSELIEIASNERLWKRDYNVRTYSPKEMPFPYQSDDMTFGYVEDGDFFGVDIETPSHDLLRITGPKIPHTQHLQQIRSILESGPYTITDDGLAVPDDRWLNLPRTHPLMYYEMRLFRR